MDVETYFERLVLQLEAHTGGQLESLPTEFRYIEQQSGWAFFDDTLRLPNGWSLRVTLTIDLREEPSIPRWGPYSLQLRDESNQTIWRFDDSPHHPQMSTYPHHGHQGASETVVEAAVMTLPALLRAIEETLPLNG